MNMSTFQKTIHSFTPETLNKIFQMIHSDIIADPLSPDSIADIHAPIPFPISVLSVCRNWRDLVTRDPSLWTILVLRVDHRRTRSEFITHRIKFLKNRLLHVYLLRTIPNTPSYDFDESTHFKLAITGLVPYFTYFQSLLVETNQSSSLPSLISTFQFSTPNLKHLALICHGDNSVYTLPEDETYFMCLYQDIRFNFIALTKLLIDGRNLMQIFEHPLLTINTAFQKLRHLGICQLSPTVEGYSECKVITLLKFTASLPDLIHLGFSYFSLDFAVEFGRVTSILTSPIHFDAKTCLSIEHSDGRTLSSFFGMICIEQPPSITLTHCSIDRNLCIPSSNTLILVGIQYFAGLAEMILGWNGHTLLLNSCPGLDDVLLGEITQHFTPTSQCLLKLRILEIKNCVQFSSTSLLEMLEARRKAIKSKNQVILNSLKVAEDGPALTHRDAQALCSIAKEALWSTNQLNGWSCTLDTTKYPPQIQTVYRAQCDRRGPCELIRDFSINVGSLALPEPTSVSD